MAVEAGASAAAINVAATQGLHVYRRYKSAPKAWNQWITADEDLETAIEDSRTHRTQYPADYRKESHDRGQSLEYAGDLVRQRQAAAISEARNLRSLCEQKQRLWPVRAHKRVWYDQYHAAEGVARSQTAESRIKNWQKHHDRNRESRKGASEGQGQPPVPGKMSADTQHYYAPHAVNPTPQRQLSVYSGDSDSGYEDDAYDDYDAYANNSAQTRPRSQRYEPTMYEPRRYSKDLGLENDLPRDASSGTSARSSIRSTHRPYQPTVDAYYELPHRAHAPEADHRQSRNHYRW
ncbi:hypothetical protein ACN47E_009603 [Coniothyrium glycines]